MKIDTYTKFILTVIALCLAFPILKDLEIIPKAHAVTDVNTLTDTVNSNFSSAATNTIDVRIVDINTYDVLNVNLKNIDTSDEMNVNIKSIDTSDEIDVNIDEVGGAWVSNGGPIKVTLD